MCCHHHQWQHHPVRHLGCCAPANHLVVLQILYCRLCQFYNATQQLNCITPCVAEHYKQTCIVTQTELNLSVLVVCPIVLSFNYFQTFSCTQSRKRKSFSSTGIILNITLAAESSQLILQNMPASPVSSTGLNLLEVLPMFADPIVTGRSFLVFCHFLIACKQ